MSDTRESSETAMEHFLMKSIKEEEVLFSSKDVDKAGGQKKGTKTVVEFTKKKEGSGNSSVTTKDVITYVDGALDVIKGALKVAAMVNVSASKFFLAMAGVATFLQAGLKFIPDDTPDPVDEALKKLEDSIHDLEKKMNSQFADLKSFVTEVEFTVEITSEAATLMKFMRDVLKYRTPEALQNFREAYQQSSPLILVYKLMSLMYQKSTNPLRMAMAAETAKTRATFDKWEKLITGVMKQLLIVEAFGSGLLKYSSVYNWDRMVHQSQKLPGIIEESKQEYLKDPHYWEEVKTYLEEYAPKHTELKNIDKCKAIAAKMDTYLTNDQFHVMVFNECTWNKDYGFISPNEKDQVIGVWNKGKCNVIVYRSKKAYQMTQQDYDKNRSDVLKVRDGGTLSAVSPMTSLIQQELISPKLVRGDGFVWLIDDGCNPHIEVANCPNEKREENTWYKGPGFWERAKLRIVSDNESVHPRHLLLVSFP